MDLQFYPLFAEYAKKYGVDVAAARVSGLPGVDHDELKEYYESQLARIENGGPPVLKAGGRAWYPGPLPDAQFWNPLRQTLEVRFDDTTMVGIDRASTKVVAHTPRPGSTEFDGKGLVVGYVQSGKTTNFTAVIAKLADEDYRFVIVLAGIHNGLRKQTQERLTEQLHAPNPEKWHLLTNLAGDFRQPPSPPVSVFSEQRAVLAVVKKNATVLNRLIKWLDTAAARRTLANVPVLIIDDEADQASVATSSINPKIRKLLELTPKHTYIGYTATPFANVFIDPKAAEDLYPKSFILNLPRPEGYFGPEAIFGNDLPSDDPQSDDGHDMIRIVPTSEVPLLRPRNRADSATFQPQVTTELRHALMYFWLATAARHARGDQGAHSTMLVHTAVPIAVHQAFRPPIEAVKGEVLAKLDDPVDPLRSELRTLWEEEAERVPAEGWDREPTSYEELAAHLRTVVERTVVILDNYLSDERLVYKDGEPLVAIAIGGNTLSRGLTLEGLVVSFFVRSANTYDTLMQMGRWFGYRTGYEDLPRIWMTAGLRDDFRHLVAVEREMREDIEHYQRQDLNPLEAAVRIRTHPRLRITAKMGAAQPQYVSFAGRRLYTRYFKPRDRQWLNKNLEAADKLLRTASESPAFTSDRATLFEDVSWIAVKRFLSTYQVHEDSPDLDRRLMVKYIDERVADIPSTLESWTVAVIEGKGTQAIALGGRIWTPVIRARLKGDSARADVKNVMNKGDRGLDLGLSTAVLDRMSEQDLVALREKDPARKHSGLLVIYPIDPVSSPQSKSSKDLREPLDAVVPVIGFGVVFPGEPDVRGQLRAAKVAVDLTDVIVEDESAYEDDFEGQSEGAG
ncbi:MAG TPA: Z1 domain-containing protein [Mycobacterium sp.]